MHQPVFGKAEAFQVAVVGHDHLAGGDLAARGGDHPAPPVAVDGGDGGVFPHTDTTGAQALAKATDKARGCSITVPGV
jgi:hypothetical protein